MQLHRDLQEQLAICEAELRGLEDECVEVVEQMQEEIKELREEVELQEHRANILEKENQALRRELERANDLWTRGNDPEIEGPNVRKQCGEDGVQQLIGGFHDLPQNRGANLSPGRPQIYSESRGPEPSYQLSQCTPENNINPHGTKKQQVQYTNTARAQPAEGQWLIERHEHKRRRLNDSTAMGLVAQLPALDPRAPLDYKGKGRAIDP